MQISQSFPMKGSRQYVHGTSILNAFVDAARSAGLGRGRIDVTFRKVVSNPDCVILARASQPSDSAVAVVTGVDGDATTFCLEPAEATGQVVRVEYDEEQVCRGAVIDGGSISVRESAHPDEIELLVALCKRLHQSYFEGEKKWLFSRYHGRYPLALGGDIKLTITKNIGTKLTCSEVFSAGDKVGDIFFS
jgi:hypothetical protein